MVSADAVEPTAEIATVMVPFYVITAGRTGLMAVFNRDGRLQTWTTYIREASVFASAEAGNAAIRGICAPEIAAALAAGRAVREVDEDTGETVLLETSGRPMRTPGIKLEVGGGRRFDAEGGQVSTRRELRRFVRGEFRTARRNPTRQTEALITPSSTADEYTMPASSRARLARQAGALLRR